MILKQELHPCKANKYTSHGGMLYGLRRPLAANKKMLGLLRKPNVDA